MDTKDSGKSPWWQPGLILFTRMSGWIAGPIIIAIFIGKFLDKKYNTDPWLFLLSVGFAFLISMFGIVRDAMQAMKDIDKESKDSEVRVKNKICILKIDMSVENSHNSESQQVSHEATLYAEPIAHIGNFTITNSLLTSWVAVVILVFILILVGKKISKIPRGLQNIFEVLLEEALKLTDSITGNRKNSEKFLPISLAIFLFILVNNWLGLFPGVGTIGFVEENVFIPLFRGGTADLNTTLALALFAVIASHVMGVIMIGIWKHLDKFVNFEAILSIPKKIKKDPTVILINPIHFFVGLIEIVGEIAKIASLSFRLFGNIFAGEVLLASMMALFAFLLPLPFMFLEIIVGIIQALIFAMLTLVFMTIASQDHSEEAHEH